MKVNRGHGLNGFLKVAHSEPVSTPPPPQGGGQRGTLGARRGSRGTVSGLLPYPPSSLHIPLWASATGTSEKPGPGGAGGLGLQRPELTSSDPGDG